MQIVDSANSSCAEKLLSKLPEVRMQRLNESMQVATAFDTRTLMLMKKFSELCSDTFNMSQSLPLALDFGHTFDSSGNMASQIGQTVSSSPFVFNFLLCLLNMNVIWERLSRVSETNHTVRDVCLKIDRLNLACRTKQTFQPVQFSIEYWIKHLDWRCRRLLHQLEPAFLYFFKVVVQQALHRPRPTAFERGQCGNCCVLF